MEMTSSRECLRHHHLDLQATFVLALTTGEDQCQRSEAVSVQHCRIRTRCMRASATQACLLITALHCAERTLAVASPCALEVSVALLR